ncbi:hypothetical protein DV515_00003578 [Chloebia gouldiae]|uniref:Uncharacterized protein n=1 Tax=Chloebia gouldiae TaxID=44316 RepID=A0A3L8SSW3_CHLGU|nr:hypothetical protein DV515_00003578 [Chloebia gouldiae]
MQVEAGAERGGRSVEPSRAAEGSEESTALFIPRLPPGSLVSREWIGCLLLHPTRHWRREPCT